MTISVSISGRKLHAGGHGGLRIGDVTAEIAVADVHDCSHGHGLRRVYPREVEHSAKDRAACEVAQAEFDVVTKQQEGLRNSPRRSMSASANSKPRSSALRRYAMLTIRTKLLAAARSSFLTIMAKFALSVASSIPRTTIAWRRSAEGAASRKMTRTVPHAQTTRMSLRRTFQTICCRSRRTVALSEQPDVALVALTHALLAQTFYRSAEANVLDIRPGGLFLGSHADRIEGHRSRPVLVRSPRALVGAVAARCRRSLVFRRRAPPR